MLAKVALEPFSPAYELLEAPHSLQHQSRCGRQPEAPDTCGPHASGCGIAWSGEGTLRVEKRGPDDRWDESFIRQVRSLRTRAILAHNRLASPGLRIEVSSSHPFLNTFQGETVAFCHNGGIKDLMEEAQSRGVTDSLIFFQSLLATLSELSHESLLAALRRAAKDWTFTSLSAMLLTPSTLHVWRCYDERHVRRADYEKYYTLWVKKGPGSLTIASESVDQTNWELLSNRTLLTCRYIDPELSPRCSGFY